MLDWDSTNLAINYHLLLLNILNQKAFPLKSVTRLLTTFSGGIWAIFFPFTKDFKKDQNVLELVVGSANF